MSQHCAQEIEIRERVLGGFKGSATKGQFRKCGLTVFSKYDPRTRQGCAIKLWNPKQHIFQIDPLPWTLNISYYIISYHIIAYYTLFIIILLSEVWPALNFQLTLYHGPLISCRVSARSALLLLFYESHRHNEQLSSLSLLVPRGN